MKLLREHGGYGRALSGMGLVYASLPFYAAGFHLIGGPNVNLGGGLIATGTLVGLGGFVWSAVAVRCPRCGIGLFKHAVTGRDLRGIGWYLSVRECPGCGLAAAADVPGE